MKPTQSPFMIKISYEDQPTKINFNRKQSLQLERGSRESLDKQVRENYLSSYPIFQATKSKIVSPPVGDDNYEEYEMESKKSAFLKNYNEKLKREMKRQLKLKSSIKELKTTKYYVNPSRSISYNEQHVTQQYTNSPKPQQNDNEKRSPSILILRKTPFLDTSASIFRERKDYSKDSTLQLLLKEINDIKMEEKKEVEKLNHQRKLFEQESSKKIINKNKTKQNFFTKYQRGFLLPMKRKMLGGETMARTSNMVLEGLENSLTKYCSWEKIKTYKKTTDRGQLQKFYNFKQIDPWDNPTQREQHHSFDNHFLFSTVQN